MSNDLPADQPLGRVLVAGATGLVGRAVVQACLRDPGVSELRLLVRRAVPLSQWLPAAPGAGAVAWPRPDGPSCRVQVEAMDFDRLADHAETFAVDTVVCALGTTQRQAGSRVAFRRVDFDAPLQIARLARAQGAQRFLLVSAVGASAKSPFFYNRVKGELEDALLTLGYPSLCVARPSLLAGERAEFRLAEALGLWVGARLGPLWPVSHRPVHVQQVAQGLLQAGRTNAQGLRIVSNREMLAQPRTMR